MWNTKIDTLPVDSHSAAYVSTIGASNPLHPDYGTKYGFVMNYVNGSQPKLPVTFAYASESDPGPYPIPANVVIEPGSDRHAFVIDTTHCVDYELFGLQKNSAGAWTGGSGAIFPLNSNQLRPAGWTSADAAGLPIVPGLVRYDEILAGHIDHAIRFTAIQTRNAYIWPARHWASSLSGAQYPPMGQRFRLKASFNISSFPPHVQVILQALKTYGMILADNGGPWFISGANDARWNDSEMHDLTRVVGADFEAVNESGLMMSVDSAQVKSAAPTQPKPGPGPAGWVSILSKNSGKCLGLRGGATATTAGVTLEQASCVNGTDQEFAFTPVSGGYKITVRNSGLAVTVNGGPTGVTNGAQIVQYRYYGTANQIWKLVQTSDGYWEIAATSSGKSAAVSGASKLDHAAVVQWTWGGTDNEKWSFVPAS